jgi:hypothetical protein
MEFERLDMTYLAGISAGAQRNKFAPQTYKIKCHEKLRRLSSRTLVLIFIGTSCISRTWSAVVGYSNNVLAIVATIEASLTLDQARLAGKSEIVIIRILSMSHGREGWRRSFVQVT